MKPFHFDTSKITRKNFLNTCGSVLAGGTIAGVSAVLLHRATGQKQDGSNGAVAVKPQGAGANRVSSPYRLTASFAVAENIDGFELWNDKLVVATPNRICVYQPSGSPVSNFTTDSNLRDIAVDGERIYLLFPDAIDVRNISGSQVCSWKACSDRSDYCSFAVSAGSVFVTDAANKNICKYTADGKFETFIHSPNGFVIPSYTFGIACIGDIVYCSNSGRHQVEMFTPSGGYIGAFGQPGAVPGRFCGCCNPVHLTGTPTGEIITSEKGMPRITCYGSDGQFRNILLDSKALASGNKACEVKIKDDLLFVAGAGTISTFKYDRSLPVSACMDCAAECFLRS